MRKTYQVSGLKMDAPENTGAVAARKTTDKLCLAIFIAVFTVFGFTAIQNLKSAEFSKLTTPYDTTGQACGQKSVEVDSTDYPYLYFNLPEKGQGLTSKRVCVKTCPGSSSLVVECLPNADFHSCSMLRFYTTQAIAGRICIPTDPILYKQLTSEFYGLNFTAVVDALFANWRLLVAGAIIAYFMNVIYSHLMRYFAPLIVYSSLLGTFVAFGLLGKIIYNKHSDLLQDSEGAEDSIKLQNAAGFYKMLASATWIGTGGLVLISIAMMSRIRAAIVILQTACKFVSEARSILKVPVIMAFSLVAFCILWGASTFALYARGETTWSEITGSVFGERSLTNIQGKLVLFNIFVLFWGISIIMTTGQFIITQAVCLWYHNETTGVMIGVKALYWTFRYHFGTVCFGSLVLTLTNGVRIICKYILVKAPAPAALEGVHRIPRAIFGCLINLAEKMVKYFTSQVLTQVALTSDNFCVSSCRTAKIMDLSLFRFEAICEILTFLGKILISVVTTIISHKLLFYKGWTTSLNTTGHVPLITLAIIFASAWCITSVFVLIWEISSDAIVNLQTISKHNGQSRYSEEKLGKDFSNSLENLDQSGLSYV